MKRWNPASVLAILAGCSRDVSTPPSPTRSAALPYDVAGCAEVTREPICELGSAGRLTLWARTHAPLDVSLDGKRIDATDTTAISDGTRFTVAIPSGVADGMLVVVSAERRAEIPIRAGRSAGLLHAEALLDVHTQVANSEAKLLFLTLSDADPAVQRRVQSGLARLSLRAGDIDTAERELRSTIVLHNESGSLRSECRDRGALANLLLFRRGGARGRLDARRVLSENPRLRAVAECRALLDFGLAQVTWAGGDLRSAVDALDSASATAQRIGLLSVVSSVVAERTILLRSFGAPDRAIAEAMAIQDSPDFARMSRSDRQIVQQNAAWAHLASGRSSEVEEALATLGAAIDEARAAAAEPEELATLLVDAAETEQRLHHSAEALRRLEEARAALPALPEPVEAQALALRGRIELDEGRPADGLAIARELRRFAARSGLVHARWDAALLRARAMAALGRSKDAAAALDEADAISQAIVPLVPLGEGRDGYFARAAETSQLRIDSLLESDPIEALRVARVSRARPLAVLHAWDRIAVFSNAERELWEKKIDSYQKTFEELSETLSKAVESPSIDEAHLDRALADFDLGSRGAAKALGPENHPQRLSDGNARGPAIGEVILVYHSLPDGVAAFAWSERGVQSARLAPLSETDIEQATSRSATAGERDAALARVAEVLLEPLAPSINDAVRVRVLADGVLELLDVHALPFRGVPLTATRPVTYALDVEAPERPELSALASGSHAVLATNPLGDLQMISESAPLLVDLLANGLGLEVAALDGASVATSLRSALRPDTRLFHYAGHGAVGGTDGVDSALLIGGGAALTSRSVLAFPEVPAWVVLAGCETAKGSAEAREPGLGLAQAFLLSGSAFVLGTIRPVREDVATFITTRFYAALTSLGNEDPAAALAQAQAEAWLSRGPSGWESFRALTW